MAELSEPLNGFLSWKSTISGYFKHSLIDIMDNTCCQMGRGPFVPLYKRLSRTYSLRSSYARNPDLNNPVMISWLGVWPEVRNRLNIQQRARVFDYLSGLNDDVDLFNICMADLNSKGIGVYCDNFDINPYNGGCRRLLNFNNSWDWNLNDGAELANFCYCFKKAIESNNGDYDRWVQLDETSFSTILLNFVNASEIVLQVLGLFFPGLTFPNLAISVCRFIYKLIKLNVEISGNQNSSIRDNVLRELSERRMFTDHIRENLPRGKFKLTSGEINVSIGGIPIKLNYSQSKLGGSKVAIKVQNRYDTRVNPIVYKGKCKSETIQKMIVSLLICECTGIRGLSNDYSQQTTMHLYSLKDCMDKFERGEFFKITELNAETNLTFYGLDDTLSVILGPCKPLFYKVIEKSGLSEKGLFKLVKSGFKPRGLKSEVGNWKLKRLTTDLSYILVSRGYNRIGLFDRNVPVSLYVLREMEGLGELKSVAICKDIGKLVDPDQVKEAIRNVGSSKANIKSINKDYKKTSTLDKAGLIKVSLCEFKGKIANGAGNVGDMKCGVVNLSFSGSHFLDSKEGRKSKNGSKSKKGTHSKKEGNETTDKITPINYNDLKYYLLYVKHKYGGDINKELSSGSTILDNKGVINSKVTKDYFKELGGYGFKIPKSYVEVLKGSPEPKPRADKEVFKRNLIDGLRHIDPTLRFTNKSPFSEAEIFKFGQDLDFLLMLMSDKKTVQLKSKINDCLKKMKEDFKNDKMLSQIPEGIMEYLKEGINKTACFYIKNTAEINKIVSRVSEVMIIISLNSIFKRALNEFNADANQLKSINSVVSLSKWVRNVIKLNLTIDPIEKREKGLKLDKNKKIHLKQKIDMYCGFKIKTESNPIGYLVGTLAREFSNKKVFHVPEVKPFVDLAELREKEIKELEDKIDDMKYRIRIKTNKEGKRMKMREIGAMKEEVNVCEAKILSIKAKPVQDEGSSSGSFKTCVLGLNDIYRQIQRIEERSEKRDRLFDKIRSDQKENQPDKIGIGQNNLNLVQIK